MRLHNEEVCIFDTDINEAFLENEMIRADDNSPIEVLNIQSVEYNYILENYTILNNAHLNNEIIKRTKEQNNKEKCSICLSLYINEICIDCGHFFCLLCIQKWFNQNKKTCPLCRANVTKYTRDNIKHISFRSLFNKTCFY